MNTLLAFDTSGTAASVAVLQDGVTLAEITQNDTRKQHCEGLMPMLDHCLAMAQLRPQDLDGIACTSGPGSFTGMRIGAAAAKGLAHAANIAIIAVPTLDTLAYTVFSTSSLVVPIMDARRGQVYTAIYKWRGPRLARLGEYECIQLTDVLHALGERGKQAIFTGDATGLFGSAITNHGHCVAPPNQHHVRASSVGLLALDMLESGYEPQRYDAFTPFYLRKPQAERELEEKGTF